MIMRSVFLRGDSLTLPHLYLTCVCCSNDVNQVRVSSERRLADVLYLRLMCSLCDDLSLAVSERFSDVEIRSDMLLSLRKPKSIFRLRGDSMTFFSF